MAAKPLTFSMTMPEKFKPYQGMTVQASFISLNQLRFHAYHGALPQERTVGGDYLVTLRVAVDVSKAVDSDQLTDTLNYAALYELVRQEMAVPSALLEHVAGRIGRAIFDHFPLVTALDVVVVKENPPMGADCAGAGVELHLINDKTHA